MRSSDKNASKMLKTGSEVRPWISLDLGEKKKLKKILLKPELPEGELRSYLVSYSTYKPVDSLHSFMGYQGKTKLVYLNTEGYIELNDFDARYIQVQLNSVISESLTLSVSQVLVACEPPVVTEDGKCTNGGFETGDFTGWFAETGTWVVANSSRVLKFTRTGVEAGHHAIISLPLSDPLVGLSTPCTGKYIARLGQPSIAGGECERLTYQFSVDNTNSNFFFRYATVLQDGGHSDEIQPFFQYRFYYLENGIQKDVRLFKKPVNPSDQFFQQNTVYFYRTWTCVNLDLSMYVGKQMFAEFTNADCADREHMGYSYIDGLCTTASDNTPSAKITGRDVVCSEEEYGYSGETSCGADQYTWSLGELHPKFGLRDEYTKDFIGQPSNINISTFYSEKYKIQLNKTYRLRLTVKSDCGVSSVYKDIFISYRLAINYKDIAVCANYSGDVKMVLLGNDCETCPVRWSPSYAFNDPVAKFPTIKKLFVQCGQTFKVTATNVSGCTFSDDVKIFPLDADFISIKKDVDMSALPKSQYCFYDINTEVKNGCMPPDRYKVRLTTEADPNFFKIGTSTGSINGGTNYNFKIPQALGDNIINSSGKVNLVLIPDIDLLIYGDCPTSTFNVENRFWYWGYFSNLDGKFYKEPLLVKNGFEDPSSIEARTQGIYIPPKFSTNPNSPIDNRSFIAFPKPDVGMGAFWRSAQIFDRGGGRVLKIEETALPPTITQSNKFTNRQFPDDRWVIWNGLHLEDDKFLVPWDQGVYTYFVNFETCVHSREEKILDTWKRDVFLRN